MHGKHRLSKQLRATIWVTFFAIQFLIFTLIAVVSNGKYFYRDIGVVFFILVLFIVIAEIILIILVDKKFLTLWRQTNLFAELGIEVTEALLLNEDTNTVFLTVLDYVLQIIGNAKSGSIHEITENGNVIIVASRGFNQTYCDDFSIPLEYAFWYRQSEGKTKEPLIIDPKIIIAAWHKDNLKQMNIKSVISAPLYIEGELYGFVNVDSQKKNNFKSHDLKTISKIKTQIEVSLLARMRYEKSLTESRADCLTGFHSRSHFLLLSTHALNHAIRYGERLVLAMLDIDGLKNINDTYGHQTGDHVIIAISDAIRKETRTSDIIGRYGGDEFVALFLETDTEKLKDCLMRTIEHLEKEPLKCNNEKISTSFSYGFAKYPDEGKTLDELVKIADEKLYKMKADKKSARN